uniref:Basic helix-loop-helix transcription factor n=1 Tax=Erythranthe lewisii TaxID=69919 RepID=W8E7M1_ERYLE|nr:basic helix-loop-helix transcription factor [Erythranthe lewisii]
MAAGNQDQKRVLEKLRKQLALAVRSIQWSYGIFWSISAKKHGALEWGDGYYNGDIKTRKTVQTVELDTDQLGLQRSDQLRELYESLSLGEIIPQPKRPTAALSPEDLTDAEWYFLVCMSFVFNTGQGLPGRTLAKNGTVWLRNAHRADTKVFSRSLLAKSASIQTIVCFPHLDGVVELGTTELVPEDRNLIHHIKTTFLEGPSANISDTPANNNDLICEVLDHATTDCGDIEVCSPESSSGDFADNLLREESNLVEDIDKEASQMLSWQFKDEANSNNGPNNSTSSSDCVSQTRENHPTAVPFSDGKKATRDDNDNSVHENQCNQYNDNDNNNNNIHYQSVLSSLLKSSHQLMLGPHVRNGNRESSFLSWDRLSCCKPHTITVGPPQRLLKKVLFEVGKMHENYRIESGKKDDKKEDISKPEVDEVDRNHVLSERKRREKINERFMILGSLVPSGGKVDKVSILDHTIEYLRGLERKVEELESNKEATELESTTQSKSHDAIERTSDNYGPTKTDTSKKPITNKRKSSDLDKTGLDNRRVRLRDSSTDSITINVSDKDVMIEIRCCWRESVLSEVMEAVNKLHLHSQTVQSSNNDGILSMSIKAKCKGVKSASAGVIRQALQKVIRKC